MKVIPKLGIKDVKHLCNFLGTNKKELDKICDAIDSYYRKTVSTKKEGKKRICFEPKGRLRELVDNLHKFLQRVNLPGNMHGGRKGHSTIDHVLPHINKPIVITMDLKNYFPNIGFRRVYSMFLREQECSPNVAHYLTCLTTYQGEVPHGSPTSTDVANLVAAGLFIRIEKLLNKHTADLTNYVDDFALSGPKHLPKIINLIERIIRQEGFAVNRGKTNVMRDINDRVLTGIRIHIQLDAPRDKIAEAWRLIGDMEERLKLGSTVELKERQSLEGKIKYIGRFNRGIGLRLAKKYSAITLLV